MNWRDRVDDMLSEGRLSAPANERMFERVYGATTGRRRRWVVAMCLPAVGALTLMLQAQKHTKDVVGLRAKGGTGVLVELDCERGSVSACPVGSALLFRADGLTGPVFVQAYAEDAGGDRTWLFPTHATPAPSVAPARGPQVLPQGATLGGQAARYRVHVVVSTSPLDREAVVQGIATSIVDNHVTEIAMVGP